MVHDVPANPLVDGDTIWLFCWTWAGQPENYEYLKTGDNYGRAVLIRYDMNHKTFSKPVWLPAEWRINEASIARAVNGNLVAAFRTQALIVPTLSDHWDGLATSISQDNGKTWSEPAHHFLYGRHHHSLINFPDGRIMLTYLVRMGQLDGKIYHGIEAVFSHDHGDNWDWERRYILARWPTANTHSPSSVLLSDGRVLTVYMCDTILSWTEDGRHPKESGLAWGHGNLAVLIWSP